MRCGAVILAAGNSTRLGEPKQMAELGGERLLERALRKCREAEITPAFIVLGAHAEAIQAVCDLRGAQVILNQDWREGMASSVRAGVAACESSGLDAVLLMTCDMPFVSSHHLLTLKAYAEELKSDVASRYAGRRGVPACLLQGSFAALKRLEGDAGAREMLKTAPFVELLDAADVDTPETLRAARERS